MIRILLLLMCISTSAAAKPELQQILQQYLASQNHIGFIGEYAHAQNGDIESLRIFRGRDSNQAMATRLVYLTGPKREIIRDSLGEICLVREQGVTRIGSGEVPLPFSLPDNIKALNAYYQMRLAGEDRVAGRAVWKVLITPKDGFRYGYRLWLDQQQGVLLGFEKYNDQKILESMTFSSVTFPKQVNIPLPDGAASHVAQSSLVAAESSVKVNGVEWRTRWLPAGFTVKQPTMTHMELSSDTVKYQVYSDGLSAISVFVEKLADKKVTGAKQKTDGVMNAFSYAGKGFLVTAIGSVPMQTVQKVAMATVKEQP
ncbi:MucB/RseB C-terminal domain-containing protein [Pelagibaculum spongiae]|uniref:Transcriptional regulator n=1 Tax=Pelagibaculum spongiae TaxID=2080658 RepID=A0A2V1GPQ3_9GAMM|nr:MucB/RseB C-terminal domain-containing protein [Pelagibaculum spongiae]PVZ64939.1 hypothetical protein DC094_18930 [Pelagibaculum spongiae]